MVYAADLGSVASGVEVRVLSKALWLPHIIKEIRNLDIGM